MHKNEETESFPCFLTQVLRMCHFTELFSRVVLSSSLHCCNELRAYADWEVLEHVLFVWCCSGFWHSFVFSGENIV